MKNIATIILLVFSQIILAQRTYSPAPPAVDRNADLPLSIIKVYENPTEVAEFSQGINIFRDNSIK